MGAPLTIGLSQELKAVPWSIPSGLFEEGVSYRLRVSREGGVNGMPDRDECWDQIIVVKEAALAIENMADLGGLKPIEAGHFGEALPSHVNPFYLLNHTFILPISRLAQA